MFNDLNNQNVAGRPAVDDIFAETDKPSVGGIQSDIETRRVGLNATGESLPPLDMEPTSNNKSNLKIIIIVILVLVVLGGVYFAYSQLTKDKTENNPATANTNETTKTSPATNNQNTTENEFVNSIPGINVSGEASSTETNNLSEVIVVATSTSATSTEAEAESIVDSDSDGLTDQEEARAGTNINVIDTDNDGLSDYEEVKIYRSNPLNTDTDEDGFLDGVEVKGGYDPNSTGKLPGNILK